MTPAPQVMWWMMVLQVRDTLLRMYIQKRLTVLLILTDTIGNVLPQVDLFGCLLRDSVTNMVDSDF